MYSLMKKIVGSSTDDYYIYDNNNMASVKEVPESHKASTYTSTSIENNVTNDQNNQQTQNNNNALIIAADNLRGTQLNRSLQQNVNDPDGPDEEANLRDQNIIMKKTITEYPENGRTVVSTYDE
jgi:hypothetical protein